MAHLAPDGRRLTATAPKVFGHVFDTLDSSWPLTEASARSATLLSGCVGIVGWIGDEQVLCRGQSGSFRVVPTSGEDKATRIVHESLSNRTVFLQWW
ncbi:hypothetical protein [Streptomyces sp. enrichment culture]|uniref:hypothetical protein n=1 Tax=Streptomyces sp. enrichment culture TaxID=1795815 RepID=UPI003F55D7B0